MLPLPMLIAGGIAVVAIAIAIPIALRRLSRKRFAEYFLFDREKGVSNGRGENLADLVIHDRGGYVIRPDTIVNVRYGRSLVQRGPIEWRRRVRPASLVPAGFSAAIKLTDTGELEILPLTKIEFGLRERMAAEIAVSEAAIRAGGPDFVAKLMAVTLAVLALPIIGVVAAIALRG